MKSIALILSLVVAGTSAPAQSLMHTNLAYKYDPDAEIDFHFKLINKGDSATILYQLQVHDTGVIEDYAIVWEKRQSYGDRNGDVLEIRPRILATHSNQQIGQLTFANEIKPWLLIANVTNNKSMNSRLFFKQVDANYPVNGFITTKNGTLLMPFVSEETELTLPPQSYVFRYPQRFSAASPPFAGKDTKTSPSLTADSIFQSGSGPLHLPPGLYLVQKDSSAAQGFSFLVTESAYPRLTRLDDLTDPLIFICTKEEFDQLRKAEGDKTQFDKVILDITNDKERAKNFMRNYFRRVELANRYFTSYKEGWKTDRGMIYLIFGLPSEVNFNGHQEVWTYKNHRVRFTFVKSGSVYDPDNYVLLREKHFGEPWYNTIDLWRKSRY
jgi:GWxTD domain-containing protein